MGVLKVNTPKIILAQTEIYSVSVTTTLSNSPV